jgi:DNA-directed RNA polymerase specialized sigma24 family protein
MTRHLDDREWVIAQSVRAIQMIAARHGRLEGLLKIDVERLEALYLSRLKPALIDALVEEHGQLQNVRQLYGHLSAYMQRASANGRIYAAERANARTFDPVWMGGHSNDEGAHAEYVEAAELAQEESRLAAEILHARHTRRMAALKARHALSRLDDLLADAPELTASTVRRRAAGQSPAEIAAEDGVAVNTVNQRLARWMRRLPQTDQAHVAPLRLVTSNPAKARGRR